MSAIEISISSVDSDPAVIDGQPELNHCGIRCKQFLTLSCQFIAHILITGLLCGIIAGFVCSIVFHVTWLFIIYVVIIVFIVVFLVCCGGYYPSAPSSSGPE
jgi:hypothetical protein